jgi:lipoic acid synthetase
MNDEQPELPKRLPQWLRKRLPAPPHTRQIAALLARLGLHTVCSSARCPNRAECFSRRTATFMILGDICTRSCRFCAVGHGQPAPPRADEPEAVAQAAAAMGLKHVVITCVTRDDLADGGAEHFARTIIAIRSRLPQAVSEVLTSDFAGKTSSIDTVLSANPDIFNHNLETVERLTPTVRPQASYRRSLSVLDHAKRASHGLSVSPSRNHADTTSGDPASRDPYGQVRQGAVALENGKPLYTKSGLMLGLGETPDEILQAMHDLRTVGCDILTIGQYLCPSWAHLPVAEFVEPAQFELYRAKALAMGFAAVASGPFIRSSYNAQDLFEKRTRV